VIRDNTSHGLHLQGCNLTLADQSLHGWQLLRNGNGITCDVSALQLSNASIDDSSGYAIACTNSNVTVTNATLQATNAVLVEGDTANFTADQSRFEAVGNVGNWGLTNHGGEVTVRSCLLRDFESGIYSSGNTGRVTVLNATLVDHLSYGMYLCDGQATVKNSIITGNSGQEGIALVSGSLDHSHNLFHGFTAPLSGALTHESEMTKDPLFVNAAGGDFHLDVASPAINAGVDLQGQVSVDIDGNLRPSHAAYELGAYEFTQGHGSLRVLRWKEQR
jgi:hypothetical protein